MHAYANLYRNRSRVTQTLDFGSEVDRILNHIELPRHCNGSPFACTLQKHADLKCNKPKIEKLAYKARDSLRYQIKTSKKTMDQSIFDFNARNCKTSSFEPALLVTNEPSSISYLPL